MEDKVIEHLMQMPELIEVLNRHVDYELYTLIGGSIALSFFCASLAL